MSQAISIDVDCTANPALANNEDIFHLKKLYATHTDYAAEVYFKSILRTPQAYKQFIGKKMIAHGMKYSDADFVVMLILKGFYWETIPKKQIIIKGHCQSFLLIL